MASSIKHHKVATTPDDGTSEVGTDEWNAAHDIVGLSTQGTSFPGSPSAGDRVFRTDLGLDCYYDGTRWLTVGEYLAGGTGSSGGNAGISSSGVTVERIPVRQDYGTYLTRWVVSTFVQTTNTGSAFWTLSLDRFTAGASLTNVTTTSTGSAPDTPSNWTNHDVAINAVLDSSAREMAITPTKTGSPGLLFYAEALYYRLIVT